MQHLQTLGPQPIRIIFLSPFPPFLVTPTQSLIWTTQSCPIHINVDFLESLSVGQWSTVKNLESHPTRNRIPPPTFYVLTYGVPQKKLFRIAAHPHPPPPLAPLGTPLFNIEKAEISHIKKPGASKEVRPSWKKHPNSITKHRKRKDIPY